jgi:hypothetical protein
VRAGDRSKTAVAILHQPPETTPHDCSAPDEKRNAVVKFHVRHPDIGVGGLVRQIRRRQATMRVQQIRRQKKQSEGRQK